MPRGSPPHFGASLPTSSFWGLAALVRIYTEEKARNSVRLGSKSYDGLVPQRIAWSQPRFGSASGSHMLVVRRLVSCMLLQSTRSHLFPKGVGCGLGVSWPCPPLDRCQTQKKASCESGTQEAKAWFAPQLRISSGNANKAGAVPLGPVPARAVPEGRIPARAVSVRRASQRSIGKAHKTATPT